MILVKDNAGQDAMIDNGRERERTLLHDMMHQTGDESSYNNLYGKFSPSSYGGCICGS